MLDELDRKLLNIIQTDFPVTPEPYRALALILDVAEEEIKKRLQYLLDTKVIRHLGALFDSRKLGYEGTLCAMKVSPENIAAVAAVVNRYNGVTHNYLRDHAYNLWFTVLAESPEKLNEIIYEIRASTGVEDFLTLPATEIFKIKVNFNLPENLNAETTNVE